MCSSNNNNLNTKENEIKKLMIWNSNKIGNKIDEVFLSITKNEIDIMAVNETKIDKENEMFCFNNDLYKYHLKSRNKYGGGVGFIIRSNIEFDIVNDLDTFNCEAVSIKVKYNKNDLFIITYYNPPSEKINIQMLEFIEKSINSTLYVGI